MSHLQSDESVFWNEKNGILGGILTSDQNYCQSDGYFEEPGSNVSTNYINDKECGGSKKIRLPSPDQFDEEGEVDSSSAAQSSPLGLTLRRTPSFLSLLETRVSKGKQADCSTKYKSDHRPRIKMDDHLQLKNVSEKQKASNFPAISIRIGTWQRISRHEGDLIVKIYYAKRKLVWEILEEALKSKMEIQWSDISAIRAINTCNNIDPGPGTLEIELNQPPLFYRETTPQPRRHTLWQQTSDFTGGQAPIWRRHEVSFPLGVLDKHYKKLLQYDQHLFDISHKPFPSHNSPYFDPNMCGLSQSSFQGHISEHFTTSRYPAPSIHMVPTTSPLGYLPDRTSNQFVTTQNQTFWREGANHSAASGHMIQGNLAHSSQSYHPNMGFLQGDCQASLLDPTYVMNLDNDATHSGKSC